MAFRRRRSRGRFRWIYSDSQQIGWAGSNGAGGWTPSIENMPLLHPSFVEFMAGGRFTVTRILLWVRLEFSNGHDGPIIPPQASGFVIQRLTSGEQQFVNQKTSPPFTPPAGPASVTGPWATSSDFEGTDEDLMFVGMWLAQPNSNSAAWNYSNSAINAGFQMGVCENVFNGGPHPTVDLRVKRRLVAGQGIQLTGWWDEQPSTPTNFIGGLAILWRVGGIQHT